MLFNLDEEHVRTVPLILSETQKYKESLRHVSFILTPF